MTGIKWKRMLAALCCAFIAISGGCANPSTSSGSSVSQESGIPASQDTGSISDGGECVRTVRPVVKRS